MDIFVAARLFSFIELELNEPLRALLFPDEDAVIKKLSSKLAFVVEDYNSPNGAFARQRKIGHAANDGRRWGQRQVRPRNVYAAHKWDL